MALRIFSLMKAHIFVTLNHDIGGLIMPNILVAIASDSYATTKLEVPAIYRQERISVVASS